MNILLQVTLHKVQSLAEGSWKIELLTRELQREQVGDLNDLLLHECSLLLSDESINQEKVKEVESVKLDPERKDKTSSQRLRDVLYILGEHLPVTSPFKADFEPFYKHKIEQMIDNIKSQLE